jgi:hypothetical protein
MIYLHVTQRVLVRLILFKALSIRWLPIPLNQAEWHTGLIGTHKKKDDTFCIWCIMLFPIHSNILI